MYVHFQQPMESDGVTIKTVSGRLGLLVARAAIGPAMPCLSNCEWTSFGVWRKASGELNITVPQGVGNFSHLIGKGIRTVSKQDDGPEVVTLSPSGLGKAEIDKLIIAIRDTFKDNLAAMSWGKRYDLPPFGAVETAPKATEPVMAPAPAPVATGATAPVAGKPATTKAA